MIKTRENEYESRESVKASQLSGQDSWIESLRSISWRIPMRFVPLVLWVAVCGLWLYASYASGGLFFETVLVCALIITCLLFFRSLDDDSEVIHKKRVSE